MTELHTSVCVFEQKPVSAFLYTCLSAAEISDLLNVIIRYYNLTNGCQTRRSHVKNEALLVELESKVLVAAGEWSWRDRQRVHTYTV